MSCSRLNRLASLLLDHDSTEPLNASKLPTPYIAVDGECDVNVPDVSLKREAAAVHEPANPKAAKLSTVELDCDIDVENLAKQGIEVKLLGRSMSNYVYTGALYAHAESICNYLINRVGGHEMAVFKIGLSANIVKRWGHYKEENFQYMIVLSVAQELSVVEGLEAFLIRVFKQHAGCRNEKHA